MEGRPPRRVWSSGRWPHSETKSEAQKRRGLRPPLLAPKPAAAKEKGVWNAEAVRCDGVSRDAARPA
jgi:hypothetical protein